MSRARTLTATRREPAHAPRPAAVPAIPDRDFKLLQALIYRESGIHLPSAKGELLARRLRPRLRTLGISTFEAYYQRLRVDEEERVEMLDAVTTNETRFFRERRQFELLETTLVPRWRKAATGGRPHRIRAWSAACSTGQEAYSLAMVLLHHLPGWRVEVLASDISTRALRVAAAAVWPADEVADIPEGLLKRFMLRGKGSRSGWIKAGPELREAVSCRRLNLHSSGPSPIGAFDLILCRNVLIYFDQASRRAALERLLAHLKPDGYLFGGHAESLTNVSGAVRAVAPTVYRHAAAADESEAGAG